VCVKGVEEDGEKHQATSDVRGPSTTTISWPFWRQNSTSVTTWRDHDALTSQPHSHSLSHRSRSGFRIVVPRWRKNGCMIVTAEQTILIDTLMTSQWRQSTARNHSSSHACVRWSELQITEIMHQEQCLAYWYRTTW